MAELYKIVDGEPTPAEVEYYEAAEAVQKARVRYSQAYQIAKSLDKVSDATAHQIAIEKTEDELTKLHAVLEIARIRLEKENL